MKSLRFPVPQSPLTLQQRLAQLVGARLTTLINPFGLVDGTIRKVFRSVIKVQENNSPLLLSPSGLQIMTVNRRAQNPTVKRFSIALNFIAREAEENAPTILNNRRIVQIGKDFIEITGIRGTFIQLIPLSNVTVIFRQRTRSLKKRRKK